MDKATFLAQATMLQKSYSPNASVKARFSNLVLVAFVGPTGAGKTTLMEACGLPHISTDVTRAARPGEQEGKEYFFRTDFDKMLAEIKAGDYAQFVINSNGEFYGTRGSSYPASGYCSMAIIAQAIPAFRALGFKQIISLYILPPSYDEWLRRIGEKRDADLAPRLEEAKQSLQIALADPSYVYILNDKVENAVSEIKTILGGQQVSGDRAAIAHRAATQLKQRLLQ